MDSGDRGVEDCPRDPESWAGLAQPKSISAMADFTSTISRPNRWLMMSAMKHHQKQPIVRPYGRLKLIGVGLALTVVGIAMLLRGVHFVTVGDFINRPPIACHLPRNLILFKSDLGLS